MGNGYDFDTSKPAYEEAKKTLNECCQKVFSAIQVLGPCTDRAIADFLGWSINRVTARRNDLVTLKKIESDRKQPDPITRRKVNFWKEKIVLPQGSQINLL